MFDAPDAEGPKLQAHSLEHDARAEVAADDLFGGPTRDEVRQALERRGDGGLDNGVTQRPVGSEGGLFDTAAPGQSEIDLRAAAAASDQPRFLIDEPDGSASERTLADLLDEFDADDAAIKAAQSCL